MNSTAPAVNTSTNTTGASAPASATRSWMARGCTSSRLAATAVTPATSTTSRARRRKRPRNGPGTKRGLDETGPEIPWNPGDSTRERRLPIGPPQPSLTASRPLLYINTVPGFTGPDHAHAATTTDTRTDTGKHRPARHAADPRGNRPRVRL